MKVTAWRIFKPKYASSAFTGEGARLFGGRWTSKGKAVVYTAGTCSLAVLEMLVHLQNQHILKSYLVADVSFDTRLVKALNSSQLPSNWREDPAPFTLKAIGDKWIDECSSAVLQVPSAIVDSESNFLLNPTHKDFKKIEISKARAFLFDPRLVK